jgi:hypothetical protein
MYKLYAINYVNAGTSEYYCEEVRASNDPHALLAEFQSNHDNERVRIEEFTIEGFIIDVEKID